MCITIKAIESCTGIQDCKTVDKIGETTLEDEFLSALAEPIPQSWLSTKT